MAATPHDSAVRAASAADAFLARYGSGGGGRTVVGENENQNAQQFELPTRNENMIERIRKPSPPNANRPWAHQGGRLRQQKRRVTTVRRNITPLRERIVNAGIPVQSLASAVDATAGVASKRRLLDLAKPRKSRAREKYQGAMKKKHIKTPRPASASTVSRRLHRLAEPRQRRVKYVERRFQHLEASDAFVADPGKSLKSSIMQRKWALGGNPLTKEREAAVQAALQSTSPRPETLDNPSSNAALTHAPMHSRYHQNAEPLTARVLEGRVSAMVGGSTTLAALGDRSVTNSSRILYASHESQSSSPLKRPRPSSAPSTPKPYGETALASDEEEMSSRENKKRHRRRKRSTRKSSAKQARREVKALQVEQTVRKLIEHRENLVEELRNASIKSDQHQEDSATSLTFVEAFDALADRLREATLRVTEGIAHWREKLFKIRNNSFSLPSASRPPPFVYRSCNYLLQIPSSLDFCADSAHVAFALGKEGGDYSNLRRNPFLLRDSEYLDCFKSIAKTWAQRMRYFDAEKAILAEEKAVRPDGRHLGHFVSFSALRTNLREKDEHANLSMPERQTRQRKRYHRGKALSYINGETHGPSLDNRKKDIRKAKLLSFEDSGEDEAISDSETTPSGSPRKMLPRNTESRQLNRLETQVEALQNQILQMKMSNGALSGDWRSRPRQRPNSAPKTPIRVLTDLSSSAEKNTKNKSTRPQTAQPKVSKLSLASFHTSLAQALNHIENIHVDGNALIKDTDSESSNKRPLMLVNEELANAKSRGWMKGKDDDVERDSADVRQRSHQKSPTHNTLNEHARLARALMPRKPKHRNHARLPSNPKSVAHRLVQLSPSNPKSVAATIARLRNRAARKIQAQWQTSKHRDEIQSALSAMNTIIQDSLQDAAAGCLQRVWRGASTRKYLLQTFARCGLYNSSDGKAKMSRRARVSERFDEAKQRLKLQRQTNGANRLDFSIAPWRAEPRFARWRVQWWLSNRVQRWRFLRKKKAALRIQCALRQYWARAELDMRIEEQVAREEAEMAAIQRRKNAFILEQRHIAALCLQSAWWNFVERRLRLEQPDHRRRMDAAKLEAEMRRLETGMKEWVPLINENILELMRRHGRRAKAQELNLKSVTKRWLRKWKFAVEIQKRVAARNARLSNMTNTKIKTKQDVHRQFILAAHRGDMELVSAMLEDGVDVACVNDRGDTPLHMAVAGEHLQIVVALLSADADICAHDVLGRCCLHVGAETGNDEIMKMLLREVMKGDKKAVNARARGNCTPLHLAAMLNHSTIAHRLLIAGAGLDVADAKGRTPLHHAADAGSTDVINLLGEVRLSLFF